MKKTMLKPRIVLIEDDAERVEKFKSWLQGSPFVLVSATSGGQAIGLINRGAEGVAGICLDHDLNTAPRTEADAIISGTHVATTIMNKVKRSVPILVHSMSAVHGARMFSRLQGAGFSTTKIRMDVLDEVRFKAWLEEVADSWDSEEI